MRTEKARQLETWLSKARDEFGGENREWDDSVRLTFERFPDPGDLVDVLVRTAVVNQLYSAQVRGIHLDDVARLLCSDSLQFSSRVLRGDLSLIASIRSGSPADYYSFATKYCHFCNPAAFPIYDHYAESALRSAVEGLGIGGRIRSTEFKEPKGGYIRYRDLLIRLMETIEFPISFKDIDEGLWPLGKCLLLDPKSNPQVLEYISKTGEPPKWLPKPAP